MRGRTLLICLLLLTVGLAGCIGDSGDNEETIEQASADGIEEDDVQVPEGAELQEIEDGYRLLWTEPELPINETLEIPEGTVAVTATIVVDDQTRGFLNITDEASSRTRCLASQAESLRDPKLGTLTCSGLTTLDDLPAAWNVQVDANATVADSVSIDLLNIPLDGLLSDLDPSQLSKPVHELNATESVQIEAEDGTMLHAEVTRPDVDAPVPTVLVSGLAGQAPDAQLGTALEIESLTQELVSRGYAVVYAHVRGTGQSGGCLDVWGPKEQADQVQLVNWIEEQNWTDGQIATYGIGYSGTTALEAAVHAPDKVDAVISFGAVTDAYRDWHFGGVPNGEGLSDPITGQLLGSLGFTEAPDPTTKLMGSSSEGCDPSQYGEAADPRAVYNTFYEVRNLTEQAGAIQAPMLYGQGLADSVTKPSQAMGIVDQAKGPVLGLVGPWANQLPSRADTQTLIIGFLDQHLKQKPVGLTTETTVSVTQELPVQRLAQAFPPEQPQVTKLFPSFDDASLSASPSQGSATLLMDPIGASASSSQGDNNTLLRLRGQVQQDTLITGQPAFDLVGSLQGLDNAFVAAYLYDIAPDGSRELISFGMANLAHRTGHDTYEPVPPGEVLQMAAPMQPVETVIKANHTIELEIRSTTSTDWTLVQPGKPGALTLQAGAQGTVLELPTLPMDQLEELPATVAPGASTQTSANATASAGQR